MEGGVRVCGIAVLGHFWCGVAVIFISKYGIAVFRVQAVCGKFKFYKLQVMLKVISFSILNMHEVEIPRLTVKCTLSLTK